MASPPEANAMHEVVCPHCGKTFEAELLSGAAPRYHGFKCPHCRLFVAYDPASDEDSPATATGLS